MKTLAARVGSAPDTLTRISYSPRTRSRRDRTSKRGTAVVAVAGHDRSIACRATPFDRPRRSKAAGDNLRQRPPGSLRPGERPDADRQGHCGAIGAWRCKCGGTDIERIRPLWQESIERRSDGLGQQPGASACQQASPARRLPCSRSAPGHRARSGWLCTIVRNLPVAAGSAGRKPINNTNHSRENLGHEEIGRIRVHDRPVPPSDPEAPSAHPAAAGARSCHAIGNTLHWPPSAPSLFG